MQAAWSLGTYTGRSASCWGHMLFGAQAIMFAVWLASIPGHRGHLSSAIAKLMGQQVAMLVAHLSYVLRKEVQAPKQHDGGGVERQLLKLIHAVILERLVVHLWEVKQHTHAQEFYLCARENSSSCVRWNVLWPAHVLPPLLPAHMHGMGLPDLQHQLSLPVLRLPL